MPLPSMTEEIVDMPDHDHPTRVGTETVRLSTPAISRPKSTAPYPEDDLAPDMRYGQHPASATGKPSLHPNLNPHADRPKSAFGITVANAPLGQNVRPSSSMGNMSAVPAGRARDSAITNRVVSTGRQPQVAQRTPVRGPPLQFPIEPVRGGLKELGKQPSRVPIKLGHPMLVTDSAAPSKGNYYPNPASPAQLRTDDYPYQPVPLNNRGGRSPHRHPSQQYDSGNFPPSNGGQRPDRFDSAPPATNYAPQQRPSTSSSGMSTQSLPPRVPSAAPSTVSSATLATTATLKPMKEGPKTFDEMGISQAKNDSDCCVM